MDRYAVIGHPVAHSLSPRIHTAFAAATGQSMTYGLLEAPVDGFVEAVEAFFAGGGAGLNVTVPFKEQAAAWVDELSPAAAAAGAVNTIERLPRGSRGHNTDGAGLVRDLSRGCREPLAGTRVLLIGAGGAARGVLRPLLEEDPAALVLANRNVERARALLAQLGGDPRVAAVPLDHTGGEYDVVINATAAGLDGAVAAVADSAVRGAFCYDLMYAHPASAGTTAFCDWALRHGARRAVDGLGMLVEQAALAFAIWRGVEPDTTPVLAGLRTGSL